MIRNAQVTVLVPWLTRTSDGVAVKNYNPAAVWLDNALWNDNMTWQDTPPTFWCDFQPMALNPYEREVWGIQDMKADGRKLFLDITGKASWPFVEEGNRVVHDGRNYDIKGANPWSRHVEAICIPAQGQ